MQPRRALPPRTGQAYGGTRIFWGLAERLWMRRYGQRGIRPDDAGTRARGLGRTQLCERAVGTVHVSDLRIRQRRAEGDLAAADAKRRKTWLLWFDRARLRLEPRRHAHSREKSWQRVRHQWREDVDHVWHHRRCCHHLGEG